MSQEVRADDSLLVALGLLIVATRLRAGRFEEPSLGVIAEWVLVQESLARRAFPPGMPPPFSVQAGFWQPLVAELRTEAEAIHDHEVRTNVQLCDFSWNKLSRTQRAEARKPGPRSHAGRRNEFSPRTSASGG